jgi:hypothetical protein
MLNGHLLHGDPWPFQICNFTTPSQAKHLWTVSSSYHWPELDSVFVLLGIRVYNILSQILLLKPGIESTLPTLCALMVEITGQRLGLELSWRKWTLYNKENEWVPKWTSNIYAYPSSHTYNSKVLISTENN